MRIKWITSSVFIALAYGTATAQITLPRIDVEMKLSQNVIPGNIHDVNNYPLKAIETTNLDLGAHWQITQHIAVGWVYSNSMRGNGYNTEDFKFNFGTGDTKAQTLFSGLDLRFSTGRSKKWRQYISLTYGKAEVVEDKGSYRLANKTNAIGGNIGVMLRMGNHLYWNVLEAGMKQFSNKLFWADDGNFMISIKMGITYNIGKKK